MAGEEWVDLAAACQFSGVLVLSDVVTVEEEAAVVALLDDEGDGREGVEGGERRGLSVEEEGVLLSRLGVGGGVGGGGVGRGVWASSQSGRRKIEFGPKVCLVHASSVRVKEA